MTLLQATPATNVGSYRTSDGKAQIDWELKDKENGLEFTASGEYGGGGEQCLEKIASDYPQDATLQRIVAVWREWHMNGTNAGLPVQEAAIKVWTADGNRYDYDAACLHLRSLDLLSVPIPEGAKALGEFERQDRLFWDGFGESRYRGAADQPDKKATYRYGTRWIFAEIPPAILEEIESWPTGPAESLHDAQAAEFLHRHGLKLRATSSNSRPAPQLPEGVLQRIRGIHCIHYRVTLSGSGRRMAFDYWGSAADAEEGNEPTTYSVLACIASDYHTPDTFEEFCSEYGEDNDSRIALQTFRHVDRFAQGLRKFFTEEEAEELNAIR